ncbi:hypothetical protein HU200_015892 [Digitaria exilis]|uniref:At1g61320/AtMIF1 LRR domain-containing protein n=1 Tax=Digitaria exilis TaxID=1010633 RepID=A0A835F8V9_9POAL|nr:hypothetical protein HU200_015892 [Digitaria exilis]
MHDDRLSELPDHILLCILERLRDDARLLATTCVLSKRWRTLPLMLPRLKISARTFVTTDRTTSRLQLLRRATGSFAAAVRFFLAAGTATGGDNQRAIKTLALEFYLTEVDSLLDIVRVVGAAIGRGEVKDLELMIYTENGKAFLEAESRVGILLPYGHRFMRLLRDAPGDVSRSLTKLWLQNLAFLDPSSDVGILLCTCTALEVLHLERCGFVDNDFSSTLAIDAPPRSRLKVLSLKNCYVGKIHLGQAPKLACLICKGWFSESCPVTFGPGSAPCLDEICLTQGAEEWQLRFSLSELLENTHGVETLRLGFNDDKIWVHPESPKTLGAAFGKLKKLYLMDVFPECDLSWTMFLIQAAPLLEFVDIQIYTDHACCSAGSDGDDGGRDVRDLEWEVPRGFRHSHLRVVRITGDIDARKHVRFARLVMERAVSLEVLVLDAKITCKGCIDAQRQDPSIVLSHFPQDKEGADALVRQQVKRGIASSAYVLVYSASNQEFQY